MTKKELKEIKEYLIGNQMNLIWLDNYLMSYGFDSCFDADLDDVYMYSEWTWDKYSDGEVVEQITIFFTEEKKQSYEKRIEECEKKYENEDNLHLHDYSYRNYLSRVYEDERSYIEHERTEESVLLITDVK